MLYNGYFYCVPSFQSTLPHGSDRLLRGRFFRDFFISIHAPSRERLVLSAVAVKSLLISIHAPSRERPDTIRHSDDWFTFQSTLPHGSDYLPALLI